MSFPDFRHQRRNEILQHDQGRNHVEGSGGDRAMIQEFQGFFGRGRRRRFELQQR